MHELTVSPPVDPISIEVFAADRADRLTANDDDIRPLVEDGLILWPASGWEDDMIEGASVLWSEMFDAAGGDPAEHDGALEVWQQQALDTLDATTEPADPPSDAQVERITNWLSTFAANGATFAAVTDQDKVTWVSMRDDAVRDVHRAADGQVRTAGDTFDVGGYELSYPGQPVGPPHIWINCRCLLAPGTVDGGVMATRTFNAHATPREVFAADEGSGAQAPQFDESPGPVPWHGVLAPEDVMSGDRRMFAGGSLRTRDLPVPLRYVPADAGAHDGAVIVGNITRVWREDGLMKAEGTLMDSPVAAEVVMMLAEGYLRGVSVDIDDATFEYQPLDVAGATEDDEVMVVTDGRIAAATLVAIPAFQEAFVALGEPDAELDAAMVAGCSPCEARAAREDAQAAAAEAGGALEFVSDAPWSDFTQADYSDDQWFDATILHTNGDSRDKGDNKLPIREPSGVLNSNGVHAAASRFGLAEGPADAKDAAAAALRSAYDEMGEEPPEAIAASGLTAAVEVGSQVSWQTVDDDGEIESHTGEVVEVNGDVAVVREGDDTYEVPVAELDAAAPVADQFAPGTRDGPGWLTNPDDTQRLRTYWTRGEGAAKIRWGQPGDFNRCRKQLAKYIANPQWLAGTCANLHKVAIGVWPGQEASAADRAAMVASGAASPSFTLVGPEAVVAGGWAAPSATWFADPKLDAATPLTITDDGRVYGHLATWGTCHIGFGDVCRTAPKTRSGYGYFRTGLVRTDDGSDVAVGHITMGTGHASLKTSLGPAAEHYDNTGSVVADIAAGEDMFGIWVAGALRPGVEPEQVAALRSATLSGDWRPVGSDLELVAALAVNVPGFPIPRVALAASGDHQLSLVASGILPPADAAEQIVAMSVEQIIATTVASTLEALRVAEVERSRVASARQVLGTERARRARLALRA